MLNIYPVRANKFHTQTAISNRNNNLHACEKKPPSETKVPLNSGTNIIPFCANMTSEIDNYIDGYFKEKRTIQNDIIEPLKDSDNKLYNSSIYVLYSPDDEVALRFQKGLEKELLKNCQIINFSKNPSPQDFIKTVENSIKCAQQNYYKNGQKTILFVNNIEQYLNSTGANLDRLQKDFGEIFSDEEFKIAKNYGNNSFIIDKIKSLADYISQTPTKDNPESGALTIISFSKHPQLIDTELLRRTEKLSAMMIPPLDSDAIRATLCKEVEKQSKFIASLKYLPSEELENLNFPYKSWKSIQKLNENNKLYTLKIDSQKIPYEIIAEFCSPDEKNGAFTYKQISQIAEKAALEYIANPETPFLPSLLKTIHMSQRAISPAQLARERQIGDFIEIKKLKNISEKNKNLDRILRLYSLGIKSKGSARKTVQNVINDEFDYIKKHLENTPFEEIEKELSSENLKQKAILDKLKTEYIIDRIDKLSNSRYKFSYQDGKDDYIDLYIGSFGWNKNILWVNSSRPDEIAIVLHSINEIKKLDVFKEIKTIEFPSASPPENISYIPTGRVTEQGVPIYQVNLDKTQ